jgi:hypothetical protein
MLPQEPQGGHARFVVPEFDIQHDHIRVGALDQRDRTLDILGHADHIDRGT